MLSLIVKTTALGAMVGALIFAVGAASADEPALVLAWSALFGFALIVAIVEFALDGDRAALAQTRRAMKRQRECIGEMARDLIAASTLIAASAERAHAIAEDAA